MGRVFANSQVDRGYIAGWVIPKTKKLYLITPCLILGRVIPKTLN